MAYAQTLQDVGKPIILPDEPVLNGYLFTGWYQDAELTLPFTGDMTQEDSLTLYGGFKPVSMGAVYQQNGDGLVISDYHLLESDSAALLLPSQMDGRPVRGIADHAFKDCPITSLALPASLTFVEPHAFTGCDTLASISVSPDNEVFASQQGVLYSKDMTILYRYPAGKSSLNFSIPSTVTTIAPYAFENCGQLRSVTIPSSVTMIDEGAFSGCFSLRSVTLPDSVRILGDGAFADCSSLASFTASGLVSIGADALPENVFIGVYGPIASGLLRQYCQESGFLRNRYNAYYLRILLDGKEAALLLCEAGLPIPEDATYGETDDGSLVVALYRDVELTLPWDAETELMPTSDLTLYTTGTPIFQSEVITLTTAEGESVTGVILTAYHGRGGDVVLPRQVNGQPVIAIGGEFLASAHGDVNSVDIGSGVIQIAGTAMETANGYVFEGDIYADTGSYAAQWAAEMGYYCSGSLYTLRFDTMGGASISARQATAGTAIRLPVPVRTGSDFLLWCTDEALTAPAPLTEDGMYIMPAESLTLFAAWEQEEEVYCPYEYVEENGSVTITGYTGTATSETLPEAINGLPVTAIGSGAFSGTKLQSVTLPGSIVSIGNGAFARSGLQRIAIQGPASIGDQAFLNCTSLTEVSLPAAVSIGAEAFMGCTALAGVTLPDSLKTLGASAFRNCTALTQAHLGSGLETLGPRSFSGCGNLSGFTVSAGGEYQAVDGLLCSADSLTLLCCPGGLNGSVAVPEGTMFIAAYAFEHCTGLTGVSFPASLAGIGESAFANCTALPSVTLTFAADAFGGAEIPASAFAGCSALQHVQLGESVTRIGEAAFMNCSQLDEIAIGAQVTFIGARAFTGADQDLTIIGYAGSAAHTYALAEHINFRFAEGANVESIALPESVSIVLGAQLLPDVAVFPAEAADSATLTWHVADESICVFTSGALLGLKRGTTTVTVAAQNGVTATTTVTVTGVPAESVTLPEVSQELARGNTLPLTAIILPEWAETAPITWTSSDAAIATVDESGVVTAHSAGMVTIRATAASGRWGETTIRTFHAVEALESPDATITLTTVGESAAHLLTITALPADHTYGEVTFASSDTNVFQVDASGLITAVHPGEAAVTVAAVHTRGEEVTLTIPVTVEPFSLEALTLPEPEALTYTGEAQQPAPVLTLFDRTLVPGVDYVILTDEAVHTGEYAYTVQGLGDFTGEASGTFRIVQATPMMTYTGRTVYEPGDFELRYELDFPCEVTATFIAEDGAASADAPTLPGQYELQLVSAATPDLVSVSVTAPITIVESYVSSAYLSCTALTLEAGQTVTVVPTVALVEGAPDTVRFTWQTDSEAVSALEGTLTALTPGCAVLTYRRADREGETLSVTVTIVEAGTLKTAALPASLTAIEAEAFLGAQGLQRIILPDGVTSIGPRAFQQTHALQQLLLPDGLTTLPEDLLAGSPCVILCRADTPTEACVTELQLPYALVD